MLSLKKQHISKRAIALLVLFLITLFVAIAFHEKIAKIPVKAPQIAETTYRNIKFALTPSTVVSNNDNLSSQPLSVIRPPLASGTLRVSSQNPRYFSDSNGKIVYLTGAHTWSNLQDNGLSNPPAIFDYQKFLDFLVSHNHNFFRLWTWEQAKWTTETTEPYWFTPSPYQRVGKEKAPDGKPKFDLTKFEQSYFDRLRQRVIEAKERDIYVSVMLFNGWSLEDKKVGVSPIKMTPENPWRGHPYHKNNNINGINGDPDNDGKGVEIHTLKIPEITKLQEAYVRKVIDTVNDLDNVLYEISNESPLLSHDWQYYIINLIKDYEAQKPKQHPVGMTVEYPNGDNSKLFASPADWISPVGSLDYRPAAEGKKVILADTDHICGICGDRKWVWKSFTRGENPLFMDMYDRGFTLASSELPSEPLKDETWISLRKNLGYTRTYANRMNIAAMTPNPALASTGYCLANAVASGAEYIIYLPEGGQVTVDLSATPGELVVEWFDPEKGERLSVTKTPGGGNRVFIAPFAKDAVLYLKGTNT
jgi:hypothetical protein